MRMWKRGLSSILAAACLLVSVPAVMGSAEAEPAAVVLPTDEEYVVGRFQYEGSIAEAEAGKTFLGVTVEAPVPVDISGHDKENLAIRFTYRVTRSDGVTGPGSLSRLRNGYVRITDSAGSQRTNFGSPTQNGVTGELREAGQWLDVSFQLSAMTDGTDRLTSVIVGDYNDFPNRKDDGSFEFEDGADITMYLEVKDLRIVDTSMDANGTPIPKYTLTTFNGFSGTYAKFNDSQWYADWKYADVYPVDLSGDRSDYRLQMTVTFASEDETVDVNTCFEKLTIKLRSPDVAGRPGDPNGASNTEHNIGWDFTPQTLPMTNGTARISIDLSSAGTNSRGLIDWSAVEKIITTANVSANAKEKLDSITMTLSDVQIVDLHAVASIRQVLKTLIDAEQDVTLFSDADKAVYDAALATAGTVYESEMSTVAELQNAALALNAAQLAGETGKAALNAALAEEIDAAAYTSASMAAYNEAKQAAQQVADNAGATVAAVSQALNALKEAKAALAPQTGVRYGDVNSKDGVTAEDALLALQAATDKITLTAGQITLADVDGKDGVTANDALLILQYATQKITQFPVGKGDDLSQITDATLSENPTTFCNPLNLNYEYQSGFSYRGSREAADPALTVFKGEYWLFASHNDGYWHSKDMISWEYVQVDVSRPEPDPQREFRRFAPATMVIGDYLYVTHSESGRFIRTADPTDPNSWEDLGRPYEGILDDWQDPAWIYNDPATGGDGFVYGYKGSSATKPIVAVKYSIDLETGKMTLVDGPATCIVSDPDNHGFEVNGENNTNYGSNPFLEGVWANKYDGKYYLTYGMPGTQWGSYADGCYVSDNPMGPFEYCENSPVSYKASGFVRGAGHGCLFQDMNGNWWKVDTVSVSVNGGFERRLDIFPATFKEDGAALENGTAYASLYANSVQGDYPMYAPKAGNNNFENPGPGWQLLSYGKTVTASSTLNRGKATTKAVDENMKTWWSAATGDAGEWLELDLGKVYRTRAIQVNFADQDTVSDPSDDSKRMGRDGDFSYKYLLEFSQDGEKWYTIKDLSQNDSDTSHDYYEFASKDGVGMRYVRVTNKGSVPLNGKFAISGLRVFGDPVGAAPAAVDDIKVDRYQENERSVALSWDAVPGAQGYIVRFGTTEDSLYNHYQVIGGNGVTLNVLNKGADYYFRIDSYNEGGVTTGTVVKKAPWTVEPTKPADPDQPDPDQPDQPDQPQDPNKVEGYAVYEAEQAEVVGGGKTSDHVGDMHKPDACITFTNVNGGDGGDAKLHLIYACGEGRTSKMKLIVNDQEIGTFDMVNTGGWNTNKMIAIPLTGLTAGETNTIQLVGGDGGFNVDFIQVIYETA